MGKRKLLLGSILKKKKNSIVCVILSLILSFMSPMAILAKDFEEGYITSENVDVLTQESFESLFSNKKDSDKKLSVNDLKYKYSFDIREDNLNMADVRMHIKLRVSGKIYSFAVEGTVDRNNLGDNRILWFGSLIGTIKIQQSECLATVVFAEIENEIQMSMTLQPFERSVESDVVVLSFGEPVLTNEMLGEALCEETCTDMVPQISTFAMDKNQFSENFKTDDGIIYDGPFEKNLMGYEYPIVVETWALDAEWAVNVELN